jgi:hypothetical protein
VVRSRAVVRPVHENRFSLVVQYGQNSPNELFHTEIEALYDSSIANLTIWWNKSSGNIERLRFTVEQDGQVVSYRYTFQYHDVAVERPSEIPLIKPREVFKDIIDAHADGELTGGR